MILGNTFPTEMKDLFYWSNIGGYRTGSVSDDPEENWDAANRWLQMAVWDIIILLVYDYQSHRSSWSTAEVRINGKYTAVKNPMPRHIVKCFEILHSSHAGSKGRSHEVQIHTQFQAIRQFEKLSMTPSEERVEYYSLQDSKKFLLYSLDKIVLIQSELWFLWGHSLLYLSFGQFLSLRI